MESLLKFVSTAIFGAVAYQASIEYSAHIITLNLFSLTCFLGLLTFHLVLKNDSPRKSLLVSGLIAGLIFVLGPCILDASPALFVRPFVKFPYGSTLYPNMKDKEWLQVKVVENVTLEEAQKMVYDSNIPLLFKGIIKDSTKKGMEIINRLQESEEKFFSQSYDTYPYDFFRGSKLTVNGADNKMTVKEVMSPDNTQYLSFEPFLIKDEIVDMVGEEVYAKTMTDTNFIGNFNETIMTASIHGAPSGISWALQMVGDKTWFMWSPETSYEHFNNHWFSTTSFPALGDENYLFNLPTYKVRICAGDILSFPPKWYHSVITHPGPNLLLNIRTVYGPNWIPTYLSFARTVLSKVMQSILNQGIASVHHVEGMRKVRVEDINKAFVSNRDEMRWDPMDNYLWQ
jgi:hypothetical protein